MRTFIEQGKGTYFLSRPRRFGKSLLLKLSKTEKTVILIDECDKPIIDWPEKPELAKKMISVLKGFFSILKGNDPNIRFLLFLGWNCSITIRFPHSCSSISESFSITGLKQGHPVFS